MPTTPTVPLRWKIRLLARCKAEKLALSGMSIRSRKVGRRTREQLAIYQRAHKLPAGGTFSARTLDHLFPGRVRRRFRAAMVAGYERFKGVREEPPGSNRGKWVERFLAHVGFKPGAAWCVAMHWYVADYEAHYNGPKQTGSRAYVPHLEAWAKRRGIIVPLRKGRAGMTATWRYDGKRGQPGNHVGILVANVGVGAFVRAGGGNESDRVRISFKPVWQLNHVIDLARLQKP